MNKHEQKAYEDELFKRLSNSILLREEEGILSRYFNKPFWWILQRADRPLPITLKDIEHRCGETADIEVKEKGACIDIISETLAKAKSSRKIQFFRCPAGMTGFTCPIVQGRKIYGYIVMCHAERDVPDIVIELFAKFIDVLVREIQKELELSKLYETIRPRAIALSTVHTIHRLLTSTLDLDELLPRIARLSLQVVRANRCSIKLVDNTKKVLLPKATVDLRTKKVKLKRVKVGMYAPGKAFKRSKVIMGKDYMAVPLIDMDIIGVITLYDKIDETPFNQFDREIMSTLAEQAVIAINNALLYKEQQRMTEGTIKSLAALLDTHSRITSMKRAPFTKIALEIAKESGLPAEMQKSLEYAYMLHDVGKAALPQSILSKPEKLTDEEYRLIKEHPKKGAQIIKPLKTLRMSVPMILHQRERYDGKGYPDGLKGNQIPLGARIVSVVSAFEAMITKRPYKTKRRASKAAEEIKRYGSTQFDPKVVDLFLKVVSRRFIRNMLRKEGYGF